MVRSICFVLARRSRVAECLCRWFMGAQILVEALSLLVRRFLGGADAGAFRLVVKLRETGWKHRRHLEEDSGFGHDCVEFDIVLF